MCRPVVEGDVSVHLTDKGAGEFEKALREGNGEVWAKTQLWGESQRKALKIVAARQEKAAKAVAAKAKREAKRQAVLEQAQAAADLAALRAKTPLEEASEEFGLLPGFLPPSFFLGRERELVAG